MQCVLVMARRPFGKFALRLKLLFCSQLSNGVDNTISGSSQTQRLIYYEIWNQRSFMMRFNIRFSGGVTAVSLPRNPLYYDWPWV